MPVLFRVFILRQLATVALALGRTGFAIDCWQKIRRLEPQNADVLATLAYLRAGCGDLKAACRLLDKAVALAPARAAHRFNRGYLFQQQELHQAALQDFEQALVLDPALDRAWYGKALSLIRLNRLNDAIEPLRRNTELQPMSPYGWYQLAHVHHRLGDAGSVARVIRRIAQFEPAVARKLIQETGVDP